MSSNLDFSIVMPCLNEEKTIGPCIEVIRNLEMELNTSIPIIVADNGSSDSSVEIATRLGATVINVPIKGYGAALDAGIRSATTEWVVIGDSDFSYDFRDSAFFVKSGIKTAADLVMGNRFKGGIEPGAMPALHKFIGNPALSYIARFFFNIPIGDFHCGLRAIRKSTYLKLDITSRGMEYATEMVVKFADGEFAIIEVPTTLRKDGRNRKPHLRSFPDGWRHLKLMMLYAPQFTLLFPGALLMIFGFLTMIFYACYGHLNFMGFKGDISAAEMVSLITLVGSQLFVAGAVSIANAKSHGIGKFRWLTPKFSKMRARFVLGFPMILMGFSSSAIICFFQHWISIHQGHLDPIKSTQVIIPSITYFLVGSQLLIGAIQVRQVVSKFWS